MDRYTDTTCCLLQNLVTSNILYDTWKHERDNWLQNNGISLTQRYCRAHELACTVSTQRKRKIIYILFFKFTYIQTIILVQELWKCGVIMRNITLHVIHCILAYSAYKMKTVVPTTIQQNQSLLSELTVNGGGTDYVTILT